MKYHGYCIEISQNPIESKTNKIKKLQSLQTKKENENLKDKLKAKN